MASNENWPPNVIKQLAKELKGFEESPLEDIKLSVDGDNFSNIHADIEGPRGTPYEGGTFRVKLVLSQGFPQVPPKGYFLTKIFHPNISKNGEICVNTLKKDWKPTLGLRHVLLTIRCLLIEPFPESALNEEAGKMLMEDYETYDKYARLMTSIHAMTSRSKMKPQTTESTTVNIVSTNSDVISAVSVKQTNRDGVDGGVSHTASDTICGGLSPCSKKPRIENESKTTHTHKRKPEQLRKKALKRL